MDEFCKIAWTWLRSFVLDVRCSVHELPSLVFFLIFSQLQSVHDISKHHVNTCHSRPALCVLSLSINPVNIYPVHHGLCSLMTPDEKFCLSCLEWRSQQLFLVSQLLSWWAFKQSKPLGDQEENLCPYFLSKISFIPVFYPIFSYLKFDFPSNWNMSCYIVQRRLKLITTLPLCKQNWHHTWFFFHCFKGLVFLQ